jgi:hypothetical protein
MLLLAAAHRTAANLLDRGSGIRSINLLKSFSISSIVCEALYFVFWHEAAGGFLAKAMLAGCFLLKSELLSLL